MLSASLWPTSLQIANVINTFFTVRTVIDFLPNSGATQTLQALAPQKAFQESPQGMPPSTEAYLRSSNAFCLSPISQPFIHSCPQNSQLFGREVDVSGEPTPQCPPVEILDELFILHTEACIHKIRVRENNFSSKFQLNLSLKAIEG